MRYLLFILLLLPITNYAEERLSVVVVGGGPVGLAAAMEAVDCGAHVTVVERRDEYTRRQRVFLSDESIHLLERWHVILPPEFVFNADEDERIAVVPINVIEELLSQQASQHGVVMLSGEFEKLESAKRVRVRSGDKVASIAYDLLVGADGAHSAVRKELGITVEDFGQRQGAFAWMRLTSDVIGFDVTDAIRTDSGFIRRIKSPGGSIIFSQGMTQGVDELYNAAVLQGWNEEAQLVNEGEGAIAGRIPLQLMQAHRFSDPVHSAIIVGDASATGSFFLGLGLNMGFETVSNAVALYRGLASQDAEAYSTFEVQMQETTSSLIRENHFLFRD